MNPELPIRRYVNIYAFVFFNLCFFFYWYAFPLANTIFYDGIPQIGTSNTYVSARYGWDWWHLWLLCLNFFIPISLVWAVANADVEEWTRIHRWFSVTAIRINLWVFVVLSVRWIFFCNSPFSAGLTACNDYRWCCVFYPNTWCSNGVPCTPGVTYGDLSRNLEMTQHWAFSLVFFLFSLWNVQINTDMRDFKVLS